MQYFTAKIKMEDGQYYDIGTYTSMTRAINSIYNYVGAQPDNIINIGTSWRGLCECEDDLSCAKCLSYVDELFGDGLSADPNAECSCKCDCETIHAQKINTCPRNQDELTVWCNKYISSDHEYLKNWHIETSNS